ncbi:MAG: hypothetical protein DMD90_00770 [Candidatus Rokuibacteriota bacterium]|nr:MAG: hypothetical protein DMD90_00770 [Candidatus Rokubacteria bacterium]
MKAWGECWPLAGASNISEGRRPRAGAALQFQLARATPGARRKPVLPARRRSAPARDARHQSADGGSAAGRVHRPQARRLGRAECRQLRRRPVSHRYGQDARPQDHQHRSRPELVPELQVVGGDLVAVDQPGALDKIRARIGGSRVPLGIDGVAGKATATIAGVLSESGTLLVYALMSGEPVTIAPLDLIAKRVVVKGFFLNHPDVELKIPNALRETAPLVASGVIRVPIAATYRLTAFREAVAHVQRGGKVVFDIGE